MRAEKYLLNDQDSRLGHQVLISRLPCSRASCRRIQTGAGLAHSASRSILEAGPVR